MDRTLPPMMRAGLLVIIATILVAACWGVTHPASPTNPRTPDSVDHSPTDMQLPTLSTDSTP